MPNTRDLMQAINDGNLNRVQQILAVRDARGIPFVDMNHGFGNVGTALLCALCAEPVNELIVQTIIDVRDRDNNPVINVNHRGPHGLTVLSFVLQRRIEPALKRRLLQRLIDLRGARGELVLDARSDHANVPLLKQAQNLEDIDCFRILQDARTVTGELALDINEIRHGTTVLDVAMNGQIYIGPQGMYYVRNQRMIDEIRRLGGRRAEEIAPEEIRAQQLVRHEVLRQILMIIEPLILAPGPQPVAAGNAMQQFTQNEQNTHKTEVTVSVCASIKKLKVRYPRVNTNVALQEIRQFLMRLPNTYRKKQFAIACLNRIEADPTVHAISEVTLSQATALIWTGIHDKTALVEGLESLTDKDIAERRMNLVTSLYEAQTEYGANRQGNAACFVGTLNKIVGTLDHAHPDVTILTGVEDMMIVATARASIILRDALKKKSLKEQKAILKSWGDTNSDASQFIASMVKVVDRELKQDYQQLLTEENRGRIVNTLGDLPQPNMHDKLDMLLKEIFQISTEEARPNRTAAVKHLKMLANQVYDNFDRSFQEEYELLLAKHKGFLTLDEFVNSILAIKDGIAETPQQKAIVRLKNLAEQSYANYGYAYQTSLKILKENISSFKFFDETISKIVDSPDNRQIQVFIKQLYRDKIQELKGLIKGISKQDSKHDQIISTAQSLLTNIDSSYVAAGENLVAIKNVVAILIATVDLLKQPNDLNVQKNYRRLANVIPGKIHYGKLIGGLMLALFGLVIAGLSIAASIVTGGITFPLSALGIKSSVPIIGAGISTLATGGIGTLLAGAGSILAYSGKQPSAMTKQMNDLYNSLRTRSVTPTQKGAQACTEAPKNQHDLPLATKHPENKGLRVCVSQQKNRF